MFDIPSFVGFLQENLPEGLVVSGGKEFLCKCRLCGDSDNMMHKHFYISLAHPTGLIMYNCFKCGNAGVLTPNKLRQIVEFSPADLLIDLSNFNKEKMRGIPYLSRYKTVPLKFEFIEDTPLSQVKLGYINKRLGLRLTYEDLIQNKICLNLNNEILKPNKLASTRHPNVVRELNDFFIGFIGLNNCTVNLRNLNRGKTIKSIDKKYINYPLYEAIDNSRRFYTIPTQCNYDTQRIRINIAEGAFDVNSIFYNLRNGNRQNEIYSSVGSKAYTSVIKMYMQDFGILNPEFHIYADNDVPDYEFNRVTNLLEPIGVGAYLHRNSFPNEKDYGVPIDKIKDSYITLSREKVF